MLPGPLRSGFYFVLVVVNQRAGSIEALQRIIGVGLNLESLS